MRNREDFDMLKSFYLKNDIEGMKYFLEKTTLKREALIKLLLSLNEKIVPNENIIEFKEFIIKKLNDFLADERR